MRDTTQDTERITRIWRWIHNTIPGEPSRGDEEIDECIIRLLGKGQLAIAQTITHDDIGALRDVLGTGLHDEPDYNGKIRSLDTARSAVEKLAALLPPE